MKRSKPKTALKHRQKKVKTERSDDDSIFDFHIPLSNGETGLMSLIRTADGDYSVYLESDEVLEEVLARIDEAIEEFHDENPEA